MSFFTQETAWRTTSIMERMISGQAWIRSGSPCSVCTPGRACFERPLSWVESDIHVRYRTNVHTGTFHAKPTWFHNGGCRAARPPYDHMPDTRYLPDGSGLSFWWMGDPIEPRSQLPAAFWHHWNHGGKFHIALPVTEKWHWPFNRCTATCPLEISFTLRNPTSSSQSWSRMGCSHRSRWDRRVCPPSSSSPLCEWSATSTSCPKRVALTSRAMRIIPIWSSGDPRTSPRSNASSSSVSSTMYDTLII